MSSWAMVNPASMAIFQMGQTWHHRHLVDTDSESDNDSDIESLLDDLNDSLDLDDSFLSVEDKEDSLLSEGDLDDSLLSVKGLDEDGSSLFGQFGGQFLYNPRKSRLSPEFAGKDENLPTVQENPQPRGKGWPENIPEDRRRPSLADDQRFNWYLGGQPIRFNATGTSPGTKSSISNDSLAFTLVYCSVFTLTLLYIAFKITMKWRKNRLRVPRERTDGQCNHAACQEAVSPEPILPYSGLGAMWIPEIMSIQTGSSISRPAVHNSRLCNNQCERCKQLAQPPPSYTKLFLEENPPTYGDALRKMECGKTKESCRLSGCKLHNNIEKPNQSCSTAANDATAPLMQDNAGIQHRTGDQKIDIEIYSSDSRANNASQS